MDFVQTWDQPQRRYDVIGLCHKVPVVGLCLLHTVSLPVRLRDMDMDIDIVNRHNFMRYSASRDRISFATWASDEFEVKNASRQQSVYIAMRSFATAQMSPTQFQSWPVIFTQLTWQRSLTAYLHFTALH